MSGQILVVTVNRKEQPNEQRDDDQNDPGALSEFGNGKDQHDDSRTEGTKPVNEHLMLPAFVIRQLRPMTGHLFPLFQATNSPPAPCHTRLRKRERKEYTDSIKRDQQVNPSSVKDDEEGSDHCQRNDSVGIDQAATAEGQLARQETIGGRQSAQAGKISKGGIRCHKQDDRCGTDRCQVEQSASIEHGTSQL